VTTLAYEAAEGVTVTVALPVMVAEDNIHTPVNPAVLTCHVPLDVDDVTVVVDPNGVTLTAVQVVPPSPVALKLIVPVHVPETVSVAPPLSCGKPTISAVVLVAPGQLDALVVSVALAPYAK